MAKVAGHDIDWRLPWIYNWEITGRDALPREKDQVRLSEEVPREKPKDEGSGRRETIYPTLLCVPSFVTRNLKFACLQQNTLGQCIPRWRTSGRVRLSPPTYLSRMPLGDVSRRILTTTSLPTVSRPRYTRLPPLAIDPSTPQLRN